VIVGGGAVGASAAFHLAQLGITYVVLCERDTLGSGSTSKSAGGIRLQFGDELNVRLSLRSLQELERFEELTGQPIDLVQPGYLFLLDDPADVAEFRAALAVQQALGVPSRELSPAQAQELVPQLGLDGVLAVTYCPRDGYMTADAVVRGYATAAAARGVRIRQSCPATGIRVSAAGRIEGVETAHGFVATDTVICAAGAWSAEVGRLAGIELPVEGVVRWMHFTPHDGGLPERLPLTIDFASGLYFHREGTGLVFGGREQRVEEMAAHIERRLPLLLELPVASSWWGFYEVSPDDNALVGESPVVTRFLYATGFSGHGFQQAPAVGEHLAELVAGRRPTLDLSPFAVDRFAGGGERRETFVV
jgi:sarcosine oxidase subunit beta